MRSRFARTVGFGGVARLGSSAAAVSRITLLIAATILLPACVTAPRAPQVDALRGREIAATAASFLGTPYRFGGADARGFDCSGLAVYAYEKAGVTIPRTAAEQARAARAVALRDLLPGDLLFFRIRARHVDHVGIYEGHGRFIHAPRSGALVSYGSLSRGFYRKHLVGAGRFSR